MNSILKYLLVLLIATGLAACDSSTPNLEGTYGRMIDGKMTPIVKVYKEDGKWMLAEFIQDQPGELDIKRARSATLYSHDHLQAPIPADDWPADLYLLKNDSNSNSFFSLPKGGVNRGLYANIKSPTGYYYQNVGSISLRSLSSARVYVGGEVSKID